MCPEADHATWRPGGPGSLEPKEIVEAGYRGDLGTLAVAMESDDPRHRELALSGLARAGALDADTLRAALADPDPSVRRRAAQQWASVDLPDDSLPPLLALLPDSDDTVTEMACFAAGERRGAAPAVVEALAHIATDHRDHLCREAAVAALGSLGDPGGRAAVLSACSDRATVRRRAVLALAAFEGPEVESMLQQLSGDRDLQVRQSAEDLLSITPAEE